MANDNIELNSANPLPPEGAQNVHFRQDTSHSGTEEDPIPTTAFVQVFVGDSGEGGESGLVPGPQPGDAAAGKFLSATGAFEYPPTAGVSGMSVPLEVDSQVVIPAIPIATTQVLGLVMPDGDTIAVSPSGVISTSGSGAITFVDGEIPSGAINGVNTSFTLANTPNPPTSLKLYFNGIRMLAGEDYTLSGSVIDVLFQAPSPGDNLLSDYRLVG